jgi:hypothetical protein
VDTAKRSRCSTRAPTTSAFTRRNCGTGVTSNASRTAIQDSDWIVLDRPLAFVMGPDETLDDNPLHIARRFLDDTLEYWQDWVRGLAIPIEWQEAVIRSAITLKLCTYEDSGAVVAALTTSIPNMPTAAATGTTVTAGCATAIL